MKIPDPLSDLSLMLSGGEPMHEEPSLDPEALVFGTVVRSAPIDKGGELVVLNWAEKTVESRTPMQPRRPTIGRDPAPRGNARGCRGVRWYQQKIIAATYHTLEVYDRRLTLEGALNGKCMVGLHEIDITDRGTVWVSSTAIDAAIEYDLETSERLQAYWPREITSFQRDLGLEPLKIDKSADNRLKFLDPSETEQQSHLHLNAVEEHEGTVYALCNEFGVILDLTNESIALKHEGLEGAHNLVITDQGNAIVNGTMEKCVQLFSLETGKRLTKINLTEYKWVRDLIRWKIPSYWGRQLATRVGLIDDVVAKPLFVRGVVPFGNSLFVGISPAAILQVDPQSGNLVDAYQYSSNIHVCIHGLDAVPPSESSGAAASRDDQ
ncbi:MAG: hypothetical protein ABEL97_07660 [Salinibacter sp.]